MHRKSHKVAKHHKRSRKTRGTRRRKYKGGSTLTGILGAARTALLPFLMYKGQKYTQRKAHKRRGKTSKKK